MPASQDAPFLAACRREPTPYTPIWLMRQAGRYQPEYRAIREKVSFVELCRSPDLACEVTVRAVDQLGVDAAILFADILLILEPLNIGFEFTPADGPRIPRPLRTAADIDRVAEAIDPADSLGFVMEAVRRIRAELDGRVPLVGFSGAPFTLASYAIEGGGSRDYAHTKRLMRTDEGAWNALMGRLSDAVLAYLSAQIDAGAQAVQLFDSWVGCLSRRDYERYVQPHVRRIFKGLGDRVPTIHFGQGNADLYPAMKAAGGDVISVDWRVPLGRTWAELGPDEVAIQGNLDPTAILAPFDVLETEAIGVLEEAAARPGHVFNLGHGILKHSDVDQVRRLVDLVHEVSAR